MFANWVYQTSASTGTGNLTLAAVSGFATFNAIFGTAPFYYSIIDDATGKPIEAGIGHMSDATTLVRDRVLATMVSDVYDDVSPAAVTLAAGTKRVICSHEANAVVPTLPNVQNLLGSRVVLPDGLISSSNGKTLTADRIYSSCLRWGCTAQITQLCCNVNTLSGTGTDRIQLGVYSCNYDGTPGPLIIRTGDIDPSVAEFKAAALSIGANFRLPSGWYWWSIASNVTPNVSAWQAGSSSAATIATPMGHVLNSLTSRYGFFVTIISGGWTQLPTTIVPTIGTNVSVDFAPCVGAIVG